MSSVLDPVRARLAEALDAARAYRAAMIRLGDVAGAIPLQSADNLADLALVEKMVEVVDTGANAHGRAKEIAQWLLAPTIAVHGVRRANEAGNAGALAAAASCPCFDCTKTQASVVEVAAKIGSPS